MFIQDLYEVSTISKAMDLKTRRDNFTQAVKVFNSSLVEFLQYNYSDTIELKDALTSSYFNLVVTCHYWSDYKQEKLNQLQEQLDDYVTSCLITTMDIPADSKAQHIFKVKIIHD